MIVSDAIATIQGTNPNHYVAIYIDREPPSKWVARFSPAKDCPDTCLHLYVDDHDSPEEAVMALLMVVRAQGKPCAVHNEASPDCMMKSCESMATHNRHRVLAQVAWEKGVHAEAEPQSAVRTAPGMKPDLLPGGPAASGSEAKPKGET